MTVHQDPPDGVIVDADALRAWTQALLQCVGTPPDIAADVAEVLVASDLRGIASHGTARLAQYLALVRAGVLDPAARPVKEKGKPALVRFNANNGWGQHAGRIAADDVAARAGSWARRSRSCATTTTTKSPAGTRCGWRGRGWSASR